MARARLLGLVQRLRIHPIDREGTIYDEEGGEPYTGTREGRAILLPVQLEWSTAGGRQPGQGGPRLPAAAQAACLSLDARRLGYTPADGDRVSAVLDPDGTETEVALYVTRSRAKGKTHFGSETIVIELADRAPARDANEAAP